MKHIVKAPSEIVYIHMGMPSNYREQLIKESYRLKNRSGKENNNIFTKVFHESKTNKVIASEKVWKESSLYNTLLENILIVIKTLCPPNVEYGLIDTWMGIYNKDQHAQKHHHDPGYKSFCYYITAEEPYTPMVFDDAGVEVEAITDRLIVFPYNLHHSVPPCNGGERIMIAGNVIPFWDKSELFYI